MSMPPLGWIAQQEQQAIAAQAAADEQRLLENGLLATSMTSTRKRIGGRVTRYATLVFERRLERCIRVGTPEGTKFLDKAAAKAVFEAEAEEAAGRIAAHDAAMAEVRRRRDEWIAGVQVERDVVVKRDSGRLVKDKVSVDVVTIDGASKELDKGKLQEYLRLQAERRFPEPAAPEPVPAFHSWWDGKKPDDVRYWGATWLEAEGAKDLGHFILSWSVGGFPVAEAMAELDKAAADGWDLLHISEANGIFKGVHSTTAVAPEMVRYLLGRSD